MSVIASNTSGATTGPDPASLARERREPSSICLHMMTWLLGMLWVRSLAHLLVTRYAELRRATLKRSNGDGSAKWFLCGRDIRPTPAIFKARRNSRPLSPAMASRRSCSARRPAPPADRLLRQCCTREASPDPRPGRGEGMKRTVLEADDVGERWIWRRS